LTLIILWCGQPQNAIYNEGFNLNPGGSYYYGKTTSEHHGFEITPQQVNECRQKILTCQGNHKEPQTNCFKQQNE
jgi:hypothetical protein